jgi:biopolymer transport protein ExbB/TolQ
MILDAGLMVKFVLGLLIALSVACWTIIFTKYRLFKRARAWAPCSGNPRSCARAIWRRYSG